MPWRVVMIGVVFFAGLSAGILHLSKEYEGVGLFYVVLLIPSLLFALLAVVLPIRRLVFPRVLELTKEAVLFPPGFPRRRTTPIKYSDIIRFTNHYTVAPDSSFSVATSAGIFEFVRDWFSKPEAYYIVWDFVSDKSGITVKRTDRPEPGSWRWQGFPEPAFRWQEPEDWPRYRTYLVTSKPFLPRMAKVLWFFARCLAFILLPWVCLTLFQITTLPAADMLVLAVCVTCFFTSLHWLYSIHPTYAMQVSIRENGLTITNGKQVWDWHLGDFLGWTTTEREFEGRTIYLLLLKRQKWINTVALPDSTTRDKIIEFFSNKKIPPLPDLTPEWEKPS